MEEFDDYDLYTHTYMYSELKKEVDEELGHMSDNEKYCRARDGSPTFKQHCLGLIKEGQKIELNEYTNTYKILK